MSIFKLFVCTAYISLLLKNLSKLFHIVFYEFKLIFKFLIPNINSVE